MKTVFITIFQGVEAKNLLRTGVIAELLKNPDVKVVLFLASKDRADYYRREFSDPRIIYEVATYVPSGFFDRLLGKLKFQTLRTRTTDLRRRMNLDMSGNYTSYIAGLAINRLLAHAFVRKFLSWLDFKFVGDATYGKFFDQYRPDVILLAHLFDDNEIALLRAAKKRGVCTIGYINSWDKLTGRCTIRMLPDEMLVFNKIVKQEAIAHADIHESKIRVVGIPQYDFYAGYKPSPRDVFMKKIGVASEKRFILYAPMGETFSGADWSIVDLLHEWMQKGELPPDVDFLVRFQPNDNVNQTELTKRLWLHCDRPGTRFTAARGVDWDMAGPELTHLADTLSYMELLVCYASSISIDAAVFGKPAININFELHPAKHLIKSPTQFYQMEHYGNAVATGGIRMVRSSEELKRWVIAYLDNPSTDIEARARLVRQQCGIVDGKAHERIADSVMRALH